MFCVIMTLCVNTRLSALLADVLNRLHKRASAVQGAFLLQRPLSCYVSSMLLAILMVRQGVLADCFHSRGKYVAVKHTFAGETMPVKDTLLHLSSVMHALHSPHIFCLNMQHPTPTDQWRGQDLQKNDRHATRREAVRTPPDYGGISLLVHYDIGLLRNAPETGRQVDLATEALVPDSPVWLSHIKEAQLQV